ncbi:MAG: FMN-binding protein [Candidatus Rokuibacteriota bacterium]|nr:MAG: FMN-binding protein [Candidatus Rokubacteria bacterium]
MLSLVLGLAGNGAAKVFYSKDEALHAAFPDAESIEKETLFLTDEQAKQVEGLAKVKLDSKMITVHTGKRNQKVLGYAMIDIHIVRTQLEAVMIVLSPDGSVESTLILAFHEALDYLPSARWLRQFSNRTLTPDLALNQAIAAISGATLSAYGVTDSARRALAVYQVMIAPKTR